MKWATAVLAATLLLAAVHLGLPVEGPVAKRVPFPCYRFALSEDCPAEGTGAVCCGFMLHV